MLLRTSWSEILGSGSSLLSKKSSEQLLLQRVVAGIAVVCRHKHANTFIAALATHYHLPWISDGDSRSGQLKGNCVAVRMEGEVGRRGCLIDWNTFDIYDVNSWRFSWLSVWFVLHHWCVLQSWQIALILTRSSSHILHCSHFDKGAAKVLGVMSFYITTPQRLPAWAMPRCFCTDSEPEPGDEPTGHVYGKAVVHSCKLQNSNTRQEKLSFLQEFDCLRTLRLSLLLKSLKTWSHSLVPDLVYHHHICVSVALGFTPNVFPRENVWKYLPQIRFSKEPRATFTCFMSNVACFLASLFILTGHVSSWREQTWCYIWVNCSKVCM